MMWVFFDVIHEGNLDSLGPAQSPQTVRKLAEARAKNKSKVRADNA